MQSIDSACKVSNEAIEMKEAMLKGDIRGLERGDGSRLESKKQTAGLVSNSDLETNLFSSWASAGAYSGKVSGAGGGGIHDVHSGSGTPSGRLARAGTGARKSGCESSSQSTGRLPGRCR